MPCTVDKNESTDFFLFGSKIGYSCVDDFTVGVEATMFMGMS